jgi:type IV pilus assembly protein PilA
MLTRLRHRAHGQEGFTLIELLVVILIIGILAAVAIPAFLNQTGKAKDSNVKSDVKTAQTAEETYFTDQQAYVAASASGTIGYTSLTSVEPTLKDAITGAEGLTVEVPASGLYGATAGAASSTDNYDVKATSQSGVLYALTKNADGTVTRTCQVPAGKNASGCKVTAPSATAAVNGTW